MFKHLFATFLVLTLALPLFAQPDIPTPTVTPSYTQRSLTVSPDGRFATELSLKAWFADNTMHYDPKGTRVKLWDVATGQLKWVKWNPANIQALGGFSPDNKRFLCYGTTVRWIGTEAAESRSHFNLWDIESGQSLDEIELEKEELLSQLVFMPDGQSLLGVTVALPGYLATVKQWDAQSGKLLRTVADFPTPGETQVWPVGGSFLVTSAVATAERQKEDNILRVLSLPDLKLLHSRNIGKEMVIAVALSPDGKKLAYKPFTPPMDETYIDQTYLWDMQTDTVIPILSPEDATFGAFILEFSPDGQTLVGSGIGLDPDKQRATHTWLWNAQTGVLEQTFTFNETSDGEAAFPFQIRLLPDNKSFVAASSGDKVVQRSLRDGTLIRMFE